MAKLGQYGHQLHTMTAQEVLDVGVEHLLTQMEKSEDRESCLYDSGNICCAAAPFIKTYEKSLDIDNENWSEVVCRECASSNHQGLISKLQRIHDDEDVGDWASELRELVKEERLQYNGEQYE
jgi:hypothetical protein